MKHIITKKCEYCGKEIDNGQTLCKECHDKLKKFHSNQYIKKSA